MPHRKGRSAMGYITIDEAAKKWGISPRRVQALCTAGRIEGATRHGRAWMIPEDAVRGADGRTKAGRRERAALDAVDQPLPRKTPFLDMTDLYTVPGTADAAIERLSYNHEAQVLFEAEIAYLRGEIDKVYERANYLLNKHSGFYAVQSAGMLLGLCAVWRGDVSMWNKAKMHMCEAPCKSDKDRDIVAFSLTALDSALYDARSFPEWFKVGNFELLPPDALPAAKVFYAKYLYALAYAVATKQYTMEGMQGLTLMQMLPMILEPMVSQAAADKLVVPELYLRLVAAIVYHNVGKRENAVRHLDRAIALALPDKLYGLLAEHYRTLDHLLEERLSLASEEALLSVKELQKTLGGNYAKLSNTVKRRNMAANLTTREREVAKLAVFGFSNQEIADKLGISVAGVKQTLRSATHKGNVQGRHELASIL